VDENAESVRLTLEFIDALNDVAGIHAMAVMGIAAMLSVAKDLPAPQPDSTLFVGHGDPNAEEGFAYQRWPIRSLAERLAPEGSVVRALGQQWLVTVAALWNDHYRARIAAALGIEMNDLTDVAMADVNRMRNDVIHHRGIATQRNTGRCELFRWFAVGEPIHVMPAHVAELMGYLGNVQASKDLGGGGTGKSAAASDRASGERRSMRFGALSR
jgi:hypothetical protein